MNWSKYTYRLSKNNFWFNINTKTIKVTWTNKLRLMKSIAKCINFAAD